MHYFFNRRFFFQQKLKTNAKTLYHITLKTIFALRDDNIIK